jgi:hypothetical protein
MSFRIIVIKRFHSRQVLGDQDVGQPDAEPLALTPGDRAVGAQAALANADGLWSFAR